MYDLGGGRSQFGSVVRQMTPAYINDGVNSVERLLANMDFAQVAGRGGDPGIHRRQPGCIPAKGPGGAPLRLRVSALYEEKPLGNIAWADGVKICAAGWRTRI